ncbi:MAG TPA: hypothetical protein PLL33_11180, partial [Paracoccus sp. (in: a-proteobacteria)]|nr:hypothetical protein [Paracoccus sp. (in: a-proteobacteria)]
QRQRRRARSLAALRARHALRPQAQGDVVQRGHPGQQARLLEHGDHGRAGLHRVVREQAQAAGLADRVHLIGGGKLAALLSQARAVVTINSTSAQQALWRGLPVKAMGRSVFGKPGLVSAQPLEDFLREPQRPSLALYRDYRDYLLDTCQVPGGFYAARSRAHALRQVVDMMLDPDDPYQALEGGRSAHRQQMGADDR